MSVADRLDRWLDVMRARKFVIRRLDLTRGEYFALFSVRQPEVADYICYRGIPVFVRLDIQR